jgi:hypothetical protein
MTTTYLEICIFVSSAKVIKGRGETVRRNFYRYMESFAWLTPIGWMMDVKTCEEVLPKLQELAKEYEEVGGETLFLYYRTSTPSTFIKQLIESPFTKPPRNETVKQRLEKLLKKTRRDSDSDLAKPVQLF